MKALLIYFQAILMALPVHASPGLRAGKIKMGVLRYSEGPNAILPDSHQHVAELARY